MKISDLKKELSNELKMTENGALGYATSGHELLDINFKLTSLRNVSDDKIWDYFIKAYYEDKLLAIKWLFFARDIRGGAGERRVFRVILKHLASLDKDVVKKLIPIIPEYGRWDDLWCLLDTELKDNVIAFVGNALISDLKNSHNGKSCSLLAKWLPSANTSSHKTRELAKLIYTGLYLTKKEYTQLLKILREYLQVVECKMSRNKWNEINYERVPSYANLLYKNAFMKHDGERRLEYLESLKKGEKKINASTSFPHDIVHKYSTVGWSIHTKAYDETLEQMWKALPNYSLDGEETIFVRDGSGSMTTTIGNTKVSALEVATALAIYFSERCSGEYKDNFITFSSRPKLVNLSNCESLQQKIDHCGRFDDCSNTDLYEVFKLILDVAVKNNYEQKDLPKNILICSDMEFDYATTCYGGVPQTLFDVINEEYKEYGYELPRLIFWNLCSRTGTIPVKENENGVVLLSGFSPAVIKMALSGDVDPYNALLSVLNSDRYKLIEEVLSNE